MLFERCYDGTVDTAASDGTLLGRILAAPIETVKLGYALLVKRGLLTIRRRDRPVRARPDAALVSDNASVASRRKSAVASGGRERTSAG